jgi:hypothetical protein
MGTFIRQYAPGRPQKAGGEETPLDRCRPTMNGKQPDDTDDPESIDPDAELADGSSTPGGVFQVFNPPRKLDFEADALPPGEGEPMVVVRVRGEFVTGKIWFEAGQAESFAERLSAAATAARGDDEDSEEAADEL